MHDVAGESEKNSAWEEARRQGVDMDLLEESIRMTPDERIVAHRQALRLVLALAPGEDED